MRREKTTELTGEKVLGKMIKGKRVDKDAERKFWLITTCTAFSVLVIIKMLTEGHVLNKHTVYLDHLNSFV